MQTCVVLLRGVNLGPRNRVPMPELRDALAAAGFANVRTYLQSGNVVLDTALPEGRLRAECEGVLAGRFGLELDVVVRTRDELAAVVERDPLRGVAADPKRYQVTFLAAGPGAEVVRRLEAAAVPPERLVVRDRELYAWHPAGIGRSKLAAALGRPGPGVAATARNWTTVTSLLALAGEELPESKGSD